MKKGWRKCAHCREWTAPSEDRASRPKKFCSNSCAGKTLVGARNPNYRKLAPMACLHCGGEYSSYNKHRKYCSQSCAGKVNSMPNLLAKRKISKDKNHNEIVAAFEAMGCPCLDMSSIGFGVPDITVWIRVEYCLVEIKNPDTRYGRTGLNKYQQEWAEAWKGGPVFVVRSVDDVINLVQGDRNKVYRFGGGTPCPVSKSVGG